MAKKQTKHNPDKQKRLKYLAPAGVCAICHVNMWCNVDTRSQGRRFRLFYCGGCQREYVHWSPQPSVERGWAVEVSEEEFGVYNEPLAQHHVQD